MNEAEEEFRCEVDPARRLVRVQGPVDMESSEELWGRIEHLTADGSGDAITFDLSEVTFMDSSGLTVLVNTRNAGNDVVVHHPSAIVRRVIEATGLEGLLVLES